MINKENSRSKKSINLDKAAHNNAEEAIEIDSKKAENDQSFKKKVKENK